MVDLLSRNLNGVGMQATVDPGRVMSAIGGEEKRGVQNAERGHEIARRLAPGGTSWAACTPRAATCEFRPSSTRRGGRGGASRRPRPKGTAPPCSSWWTSSGPSCWCAVRGREPAWRRTPPAREGAPALKAYLDGERNVRAAQFDSAVAGFQAATELDSSFALARSGWRWRRRGRTKGSAGAVHHPRGSPWPTD